MTSANFILLLGLIASNALTTPAFANEISLQVGQTKTLPLSAKASVQVGSKSVLKALDKDDHLLLIGLKKGSTFVNIDRRHFKVHVVDNSTLPFLNALTEWNQDKMGLKIDLQSGVVRVEGDLYVFKDWQEISQLSRRFNSTYVFLAKPSHSALKEATAYFESKVKDLDLPSFRMSKELPLKLRMKANNKAAFERAKVFFGSFGISIEASESPLEIRPLIKTSVVLAEVSRSASSSIGMELGEVDSIQLLPKLKGPESVMASLKALESRGLGKILASPTLNCRSGAEAEFHAGGEFPIKITGYKRQNVEWKKHGVVLKVKPLADNMGSIQLSIETEISLVDTSQLVDGLPAMKTNRVNSAFDLKQKSTVVLSGLLQETWGRSQSGLFGLSRIPILGVLFRSEEFLNRRSELMVFVTPEVVEEDQLSGQILWPSEWNSHEL